jgi:hypothetical protein
MGKSTNSAPNIMEAPKQAPVPKSKITAKPVKYSQPKPNILMNATQPNQSPSKDFSDLLDNIPVDACVEITRRILTSIPTLLLGELGRMLSSKPLSSS